MAQITYEKGRNVSHCLTKIYALLFFSVSTSPINSLFFFCIFTDDTLGLGSEAMVQALLPGQYIMNLIGFFCEMGFSTEFKTVKLLKPVQTFKLQFFGWCYICLIFPSVSHIVVSSSCSCSENYAKLKLIPFAWTILKIISFSRIRVNKKYEVVEIVPLYQFDCQNLLILLDEKEY